MEYISELYEYRIFEHAEKEDKEFVKFEIDSMLRHLRSNFPLMSMLSQSPEALENILNNAIAKKSLKQKIVEASTMEKAMEEYSLESLKELDEFLESKVKGMIETLEKRHLDKISNVEATVDSFGEIQNEDNVLSKTGKQTKLSPSNGTFPNRIEIDRIHWKNLSLKTFFTNMQRKKGQSLSKDCLFQKRRGRYHISSQSGNHTVELNIRDPKTTNWGGLIDAEDLKLADFIDTFTTNKTRRKYYLHDWSLPGGCK